MAKKSFFAGVTALITALSLILTGIMDYTFALDGSDSGEAGGALLLELDGDENITDFYVFIKDKNGKSAMVGKKQNTTVEADDNDPIKAEDVTEISLTFKWNKQEFSPDEIKKLEDNNGLIAYHIGKIEGFDVVGLGCGESNAVVTNNADYNASYWIDGEYLYIRLDEGAYNRNNFSGGFTFTGELDLQEIAEDKGKMQIGPDIEYTFAPESPEATDIFIDKRAEGYIRYNEEEDFYYQEFHVYVGSINGSAKDVHIKEELGGWFEEIYNVKIEKIENGVSSTVSEGETYAKPNPITITLGDTPYNPVAWRDYGNVFKITYFAKLDKRKDDNKELMHYSGSDDGKNTVTAESDVGSSQASAWINVQTPSVSKRGAIGEDENGDVITWRITVKTTEMSGNEFTLTDVFVDEDSISEYIDLTDFKALLQDKEFEYDQDRDEYYIEFTTPIDKYPEKDNVTITNNAEVRFEGDDDPFEASATVILSPNSGIEKTLVSYEPYEPDKDYAISENYNPDEGIYPNIFTWKIAYDVPKKDNLIRLEIIDNHYYYGDKNESNLLNNVTILEDSIEIIGADGKALAANYNITVNDRGFRLEITDSAFINGNKGKTIYIRYKSRIDVPGPVPYIENLVQSWDTDKEVSSEVVKDIPTFTTHKKAYDTADSFKTDGTIGWVVCVESNVGFKAGDEICITDILPEGLTLIDDSIFVDYLWDSAFNSGSDVFGDYYISDFGMELPYYFGTPVEGGTKYTFFITIPDKWDEYKDSRGGTPVKNEPTAYIAIKFKTQLADGYTYNDFLTGKIAGFTNHASSIVTKDDVPKKGTDATATFIPDFNKDNALLNKTANTNTPDNALVPNVQYVITVNSNRETLLPNGGELKLIDTMGKRISPKMALNEETQQMEVTGITVYKVDQDGGKHEVGKCWEYDETLNRLTFTLEDSTAYEIVYDVDVDFPYKEGSEEEQYDEKDFHNTASLIIESNSVTSGDDGKKWFTTQSAFLNSESGTGTKVEYTDVSITKNWANTYNYAHNIRFELTWIKYSADGKELGRGSEEPFYAQTNKNGYVYTITGLPAAETDAEGNLVSYYVYTLKEAAVDGVSLDESDYDVDYDASKGIEINGKELFKEGKTAEISILNTHNSEEEEDDEEEEETPTTPTPDLSIVKTQAVNGGDPTDAKLTVEADDTVTYYITVENTGDGAANNVVITDTIPSGLTLVENSISDKGKLLDDEKTIEWTIASIGAGASKTVSFQVTVPEVDETTSWKNTASMTFDNTTETSNEVEIEEEVHVPNTPQLSIEKTQAVNGGSQTKNKQTVKAGDTVTYSITVKNTGDAAAENVEITDVIPEGLTLVNGSIDKGGILQTDGKTIKWTVTSIGAGASETVSFKVTVPKIKGGAVWKNTALMTFDKKTKPSDPVEIEEYLPELTIEKTQAVNGGGQTKDKQTVEAGDTVTYYITVENFGNGAATNVVITDEIPEGLTLVEGSINNGGSLQTDGKTIKWTIALIEAGASETVSFKVTVPEVEGGAAWKNIASKTFDNETETSNEVEIEEYLPKLTIEKTQAVNDGDPTKAKQTVKPGDTVTYSITVENSGNGAATGVVITDEIPEGLTLDLTDSSGVRVEGNKIVWEIGDLEAGGSVTVSVMVKVPDEVEESRTWTNIATVSYEDDPEIPSNEVEIEVNIPQLTIVKTQAVNDADPTKEKQTVEAGDTVTYYLTVENTGDAAAENVVITDVIPGGLTLVEGSISDEGELQKDEKTILWDIGELEAGGVVEVSFQVTVPKIEGGASWKNIASMTFDDETETSNEVEIEEYLPKLTIEKTQAVNNGTQTKDKQTVKANDTVTYYITVTNTGNITAKDVVITDVIPDGLTLDTIDRSGVRQEGSKIIWEIGDLEPDGTVTVSFMVKVPEIAAGASWENIAKVSYEENPEIPSNKVEIEEKPKSTSTTNTTNPTPSRDPEPEPESDPEPEPEPEPDPDPTDDDDLFNLDDDGLPRGDNDLDDPNLFDLNDDGLPRGDQDLDDPNLFDLNDDGLPRGDQNLQTGVVIGGGVFIAAGALVLSAMALSAKKLRRSKKNK